MPFCRNCGNEINDTDRFCSKCGQSISVPKEKNRTGYGLIITIAVLSALLVTVFAVIGVFLNQSSDLYQTNLQSVSQDKEDDKDDDEDSVKKAQNSKKVGISFPTKDLSRWQNDGNYIEEEFEALGYDVDLQYAANDVATQLSQIENMINSGCDVLIIAPIEGSSLGEVLDMAESKNIPVIAYDRLIMESDTVDYYVTFDSYKAGQIQGEYIAYTLGLVDNATGPFTLEITAGDPDDNNALFCYQGAMDALNQYIDEGKLVVVSGQTYFSDAATASWKTETAQSRAEAILTSFYADGTDIDAWLCSNDSTALGVENALATSYTGEYPIITGQDCDISNIKNMIDGKQSMSVFKDTRLLRQQVVNMVDQILNGETVEVNDTETFDNGKRIIPTYLCDPIFVDCSNYEEILINSGYYELSEIKNG